MVYPALPPGFQDNIQKLLDLGLSKMLSGRPVTGLILADEGGGRATVILGGRQFSLSLGTSGVTVGQSFTAQLVEGRLVVTLGSQETSVPVDSLLGQSVSRPLPAVLSGLGAPATPAAQAIAQALLAAEIPLSAEVIKALLEVLPHVTGKDVAVLAFLFSRGLPISAEIFPTVQRLLSNRTRIGEGLAALNRGLDRLERELDALEDRVVAIQHREELADRRHNLRREFIEWKASDTPKHEEKLAQDLEEAIKDQSASLEAVRFADATGARLALLLYDLYVSLSRLHAVEGLALQTPVSLLLDQVNDLYEALAGQNLRHLPDIDPDQPPLFLFQVPVILEGQPQTLELLYRHHARQPEKGGVLTIRLELSQLGPMKITFDLRDSLLTLTITVTRADLMEVIERELDTLREALIRAGFQRASISVIHGEVPATLREEAPETVVPSRPPSGLDIRV